MMRSMFSGVSGLRVHQTKMDVIGNNIANVNTAGFKSQRVTFNEVFSQTLQNATAASDETGRGGRNAMQIGLGVNVASIDMLMTSGATQRTDKSSDLMINGSGFFVVKDAKGTYFTRAGALNVDNDGNLVISNGMIVQGWPSDTEGKNIVKGATQNLKVNSPDKLVAEPVATEQLTLSGNLNVNDGEDGYTTQIKMYDSLGNIYTTNVKMTYDTTSLAWTASYANVLSNGTSTYVMMTDQNGNQIGINVTGQTGVTAAVAATPTTPATVATATLGTMTFNTDGTLATVNGVATDKSAGTGTSFTTGEIDLTTAVKVKNDDIVLDSGATVNAGINATVGTAGTAGGTLKIDVSTITQYMTKSDIDCDYGDLEGLKGGQGAGSLSSYAIGTDGKITATYSNGDQKLLGQISLAEFDNPAGLQKMGENLFEATANSGDYDNIGSEGVFYTGILEMSNVDLSSEFTEMITTQRGFQANSKIITTSDEMLQTLVNLK